MNGKDIEYVFAIVKHRSISKAAQELYIAQPSLSRYIRTLEKRLGVDLFDRSTSPLELTAAGKRYVHYAESISSIINEMQREFLMMSKKPAGRLNLGVPLVIGDYILPRILPRFLKDNSAMEIIPSLEFTPNLIDMLISNKLDVIVCADHFTRPGFKVEQIVRDNILLVARKDHPALASYDTESRDIYRPLRLDLRSLKDEQFILCDPKMILYQTSQEIFKKVGIKPTQTIENPTIQLTMELASQGIGFAFIMQALLKYGRYEVSKTLCPIKLTNAHLPVYIAYPTDKYENSPTLQLLVSCIKDEYQNSEL
jgi:DNA-binding transcriptional LysR family regulator